MRSEHVLGKADAVGMDAGDHDQKPPGKASSGAACNTRAVPTFSGPLADVVRARRKRRPSGSSQLTSADSPQTAEPPARLGNTTNVEILPAAVIGHPGRASAPKKMSDTKELAVDCDLPVSIGLIEEERTFLFRAIGRFLPDLFEPLSKKPARAGDRARPKSTARS